MNRLIQLIPALLLAGALAAVPISGRAASVGLSLSADEVMQKAVARAESASARGARPDYVYSKHTVFEDLDTTGHVKDHKDKLFEVSVVSGLSYLKLVQLNGQKLSASELKKENERETAERQKMLDAKPGHKGDERENFLTADLVSRFQFTLQSRQALNGRDTYVLAFEPKRNLPVKTLTDRFVNQMAGLVWIDAEDFEIARAEVHLKGEVTLWGGVVGTLRHCRYTLERTRLADGVWFNQSSHGIFEGRKLLEPMMIRTKSESSAFHPGSVVVE